MISFQCPADQFAPYTTAVVVVPTTNENVVEASGAFDIHSEINAQAAPNNNAAFQSLGLTDAFSAQAAANGRGVYLDDVIDRGRDGIAGARQQGHIGVAALRGGDVVGEHEVVFAGASERIKLGHIATSREIFSKGAVRAALWSRGLAPGMYDMLDVLGFSGQTI